MVLIGKGLLASSFKEYEVGGDVLIFASGVSNSAETRISEFNREMELFNATLKAYPNVMVVYFSTASIYDLEEMDKPYVKHKLRMESLIKLQTNNFVIFRVTNVVGNHPNQNTIFNFLTFHIRHQKPFLLWEKAYRNLIDIDHLVKIIVELLQNKKNEIFGQTVNVGNPKDYSVKDMAHLIAKYLNTPLKATLVEKGGRAKIDLTEVYKLLPTYKTYFEGNYLEQIIEKYIKNNQQ